MLYCQPKKGQLLRIETMKSIISLRKLLRKVHLVKDFLLFETLTKIVDNNQKGKVL